MSPNSVSFRPEPSSSSKSVHGARAESGSRRRVRRELEPSTGVEPVTCCSKTRAVCEGSPNQPNAEQCRHDTDHRKADKEKATVRFCGSKPNRRATQKKVNDMRPQNPVKSRANNCAQLLLAGGCLGSAGGAATGTHHLPSGEYVIRRIPLVWRAGTRGSEAARPEIFLWWVVGVNLDSVQHSVVSRRGRSRIRCFPDSIPTKDLA